MQGKRLEKKIKHPVLAHSYKPINAEAGGSWVGGQSKLQGETHLNKIKQQQQGIEHLVP